MGQAVDMSASDRRRTKAELVDELNVLRCRVRDLEGAEDAPQSGKQAPKQVSVEFDEAIEALTDGIAVYDADDRLVQWSGPFDRMLAEFGIEARRGATLEEITRSLAEKGFYADAEGRLEAFIEDRLKAHRKYGVPIEQRLSDGKWVEVTEYRTRSGGTVVVRTDITQRKRIEDELRASRQAFKDFAESASDIFCEMDENLRFKPISGGPVDKVSALQEHLYGKTRWEVAGGNPQTDERWRLHRATLEAREPFRDFEYDYEDSETGLRHWSICGKPVFDGNGVFKGYRCTTNDITESKRARIALKESEARLDAFFTNAPIGLALLDDQHKVSEGQRYLGIMERHVAREPCGYDRV